MKVFVVALFLLCAGFLRAADVDALIQTGDKLDSQFKTQEALQVYLHADQLEPNDSHILQKIAREYGLSMVDVNDPPAKIERGQKALDYAKRAVAADEKNATAQLALSISYGRLAELSDNKTKLAYARFVKEYAERAVALDPTNDLAYYVLGAWNFGFANLNPVVRGLARFMYGDLPEASNQEAIRNFKKALSLNSDRLGTHISLGQAYAAMGDKAAARKELLLGLSLPSREKDDEGAKAKGRAALAKL